MIIEWKELIPKIAKRSNSTEEEVKKEILNYSKLLSEAIKQDKNLEYDFFFIGKIVPYYKRLKTTLGFKEKDLEESKNYLSEEEYNKKLDFYKRIENTINRYRNLLNKGREKDKSENTPYTYIGSYVNYKKINKNNTDKT